MKAAFITETGGPEVIQYGDIEEPVPRGSQVRIRVTRVAVNPIDTYIRAGANYWELPQPYVLGSDFAGEIESVGPDVKRFQPGQRVWGTNQGFMGHQGTFAELIAVDEDWVYPTPDNVDDETVAASALVGVTAHLGLFREAALRAGDILMVNGGSGGVGSMVVQMAKATGAQVVATAGSDEKCRLLQSELGADHAINYREGEVSDRVLTLFPDGVNVYWETVREPDFDRIVSVMAERGRIILMAGRDARPEFPVGPFYVKECSLHGFVMFKASAAELRACAEDINRWLSSGSLKPRISHRFDLSETAEAHRLQEESTVGLSGALAGKIVLSVG